MNPTGFQLEEYHQVIRECNKIHHLVLIPASDCLLKKNARVMSLAWLWAQEGQMPSPSGLGVGQLDCAQSAIANYTYTGVADDLRMTLVQTEVARHLVHERRELLERLLDLLAMTQYIHTQRRKTDVHVEHDDINSAAVRTASRVCMCVGGEGKGGGGAGRSAC
jgi:hypothetical protein